MNVANEGGGTKRIATIIIGTGNIGIGNTSTLATFNKDLGRKCFGLAKMDSSAICGITGANSLCICR